MNQHKSNLSLPLVNPRPPKGGCCNPLRFCSNFFFFFTKTLPGNHFYTLNASFDVFRVKLRGVVWVKGSSKRMVEGGGCEIQ